MKARIAVSLAVLAVSLPLAAQQPAPPIPQYGPNITLEQAKRVAAAAAAEAAKRGWPMAVAVVDTAGQLVYFQRADNTQSGSILVAQDKAVTAAMYRRPTRVIQDAIAGGGAGIRFMTLRNMAAVEGGIPLSVDGKIVGALGVSGMASDQDGEVAKAAVESFK